MFSFILILVIINIVFAYYHCNNNLINTKLYSGGFNKKVISDKDSNVVKDDGKCSCFSGKSYDDCCGGLHNNLKSKDNIKPSDILRARYTAYKLSLADYIIDTSHPKSEDYIKYFEESQASLKSGRKRWEKEILALSRQNPLEYLHFNILNEKSDENRHFVTFEAIFKESDNEILAVEEESEFLYNKEQGWLYKDGITKDMDLEKTKEILQKLGLKFDIETESLIDDTTEVKTTKVNKLGKKEDLKAPVLTNKGKLGVFNKNKKNYIPKGTSSS